MSDPYDPNCIECGKPRKTSAPRCFGCNYRWRKAFTDRGEKPPPTEPRPTEWMALPSGLCNEALGCERVAGVDGGGRGKCPKHLLWWWMQYNRAGMKMPYAPRNVKRKAARKKKPPKVERPCIEDGCPDFVGSAGAWDRCPSHYARFLKSFDAQGLPRPERPGGRDPRCTWPDDEVLIADMKELGSITKVAKRYGKSDSSLRNFLSVPRRRWLRLEMEKYRQQGRGWPSNPVTGKKWNTHGKGPSEYDRRTRNRPTAQAHEYAELIIGEPCSYCGAPGDTLDHILALSRNGTSEWDNIAVACHSCNSRKNNKSLLGFMLDSMDEIDQRRDEREVVQRLSTAGVAA